MTAFTLDSTLYKLEGKQVFWWNGEKWLVKETCKTVKEAKTLLADLNKRLLSKA